MQEPTLVPQSKIPSVLAVLEAVEVLLGVIVLISETLDELDGVLLYHKIINLIGVGVGWISNYSKRMRYEITLGITAVFFSVQKLGVLLLQLR